MTSTTSNHSSTVHTADPAAPPGIPRAAAVRLRNAFTITSRRSSDGHEHHLITAPKHGPDRTQARRAILAVLQHAHQHHFRVSFTITLGNYTQHPLHLQNGYDPALALIEFKIAQNDPYTWLQRQLHTTSPTTDTNSIIGVAISTWLPLPNAQTNGRDQRVVGHDLSQA